MLLTLSLATLLGAAPAELSRGDSLRADQEVREVVLRNASDVRRCYENEGLRRNATLSGTVEIELIIRSSGRVQSVGLVTSTLGGNGAREVTKCIATAARNWRFEHGSYAVTKVVFPFFLAPDASAGIARRDAART